MDATDGISFSSRYTPQIRDSLRLLRTREAKSVESVRESDFLNGPVRRNPQPQRTAAQSTRVETEGVHPHRPVVTAAEVHIPWQVTREFVRLPLNHLDQLIHDPNTIFCAEPGSDISCHLGLPQPEHRFAELSTTDLREGSGRKGNGTHLGSRSIETTKLIPDPIMDAHEILAAGSPQPIPHWETTLTRDEIPRWVVQHFAERQDVSYLTCLRINRDQIGFQDREAELQHTIPHRPVGAGHDELAAESGSSHRAVQHAHAGRQCATREGRRLQGDLHPVCLSSRDPDHRVAHDVKHPDLSLPSSSHEG